MNEYYIPILIAGTILFLVFLFFIVFYMLLHKRGQQQMIYDHDKSLLMARLDEQERAMNQISREVHDNVSQKVDFLQMNIKALVELETLPPQDRFIENSYSITEQIGNDLRNISYSLNTDYVTARGLGEVLTKELTYISTSKKMECDINITGLYTHLTPEQELLIFRIAQEALHNSIKYAHATAIKVVIDYGATAFTMEIVDNGNGFDAHSPQYKEGLGMRNMHQRAKLLNGTLIIASSPKNGCTITLTIPQQPDNKQRDVIS